MTAWTEHVKKYASENNVSYREAMKLAKATYKKDTPPTPEPTPTPTPEDDVVSVSSEPMMPEEGEGAGLSYRKAGKFPPKSRKLIAKVGDEKITSLIVERSPLSFGTILNWMTLGYYNKAIQKTQPFDSMFHLRLIINKTYMVEKNQVLKFAYAPKVLLKDTMVVKLPKGFDLTINEFLENTRKKIGNSKFSRYDAVYNNCQMFVKDLLKSNGLLTPELNKFIVQDVRSLFTQFPPFVKKLVKRITNYAAKMDRLIQGEGKKKSMLVKGAMMTA